LVGDAFFEAPEEQSVIKTMLVRNYFGAWTKILLPRSSGQLAYIDLFSGPGRYEDGSPSTPLWVLNYSIKDPTLRTRLVAIFNDKNPAYAEQLRAAIAALPDIDKLTYQPRVFTREVGREVVALLGGGNRVPALFFIDPFGYKGLSLDLLGTALKSWGCDCIFLFNYNRINPGINNPFVVEHMNDLFGVARAERLREKVRGLTPEERQSTIIGELTDALKEVGGRFVLPFAFQSQYGERTSHYIIFVSKAFLGYHVMKEVMSKLTTDTAEVKRFEYVPVKSTQMALFPDFGKNHSIPLLKDVLMRSAAGRTFRVGDIYEQFTVDTPYTLKNVKDALTALEAEGRITIDPPVDRRQKRKGKVTLADDKVVTFPL
jgi:three-Cys-motif partner protein